MIIRCAGFLFALPILLATCGCGGAAKPKTEDPVKIEEIRQQQMQSSQREMNSSK